LLSILVLSCLVIGWKLLLAVVAAAEIKKVTEVVVDRTKKLSLRQKERMNRKNGGRPKKDEAATRHEKGRRCCALDR